MADQNSTNTQGDSIEECKCIEGAISDVSSVYSYRISKNKISNQDFKTYVERGKSPEKNNCTQICSYNSVSIDKVQENDNKFEQILDFYKDLSLISPGKMGNNKYLFIFKIIETSGKIKPSPKEGNSNHCSLFKSKNFAIKDLVKIDIVRFR